MPSDLDRRRVPATPRLLGTDRADRTIAGEITEFADRLVSVAGPALPSAVVVDVGQVLDPYRPGHRWAVVEANMAWFSHAYAADPARVLDVVLRRRAHATRATARSGRSHGTDPHCTNEPGFPVADLVAL